MCGIVGYTGREDASPILMEGLRRLEYRGYDSAGLAVQNGRGLEVRRAAGKVNVLSDRLESEPVHGTSGIAHTRWATHGPPTEENAHPHLDCQRELAVVHNGIIENAEYLRGELREKGHEFRSDTDTEILAHLVEEHWVPPLHLAVARALERVEGAFGIAVISAREPDRIVCARKGSPLMVGLGDVANLVASDAAALLEHTRKVIYLEDGEIAVLDPDGVDVLTRDDLRKVNPEVREIEWDLPTIEKKGHPHFMHKEIYEQPESLESTLRGRILPDRSGVRLGGLASVEETLASARRIVITACGTSWHAGIVGKYMLEEFAGVQADVEYASEWRYRDPVLEQGTVVLAVSQSGETADTLAAVRLAREKGCPALGLVNVVGSTIARETDAGIYLHAGPEIGVASTKAFTSQVAALALVALKTAHLRGAIAPGRMEKMLEGLSALPEQVGQILGQADAVEGLADALMGHDNFLYLGRGYSYPVALEGALKLKEISYVHAEGLSAAEMKHGPIALIDDEMPVVVTAPRDGAYKKVVSNVEEVRARGGRIVAITTEPNGLQKLAHECLLVPEAPDPLLPVLTSIPLQLLAYHIGVRRGCDVDKPRNLAKSVTVE